MVIAITLADLFWPRTNVAILYVIPLLLVGMRGEHVRLRPWIVCLVALTYAAYYVKNTITTDGVPDTYVGYRLFNRTTVALMIVGMGLVLKAWIRWQNEQADPELPAAARDSDREIGEILALLLCALLIVTIAAIDLLAPVSYNLAILCPIPLFLCAWAGNHRLPWAMLVMLLALAVAGFFVGKSITDDGLHAAYVRNRVLAAVTMVAVTAIVSYWMTAKQRIVRQGACD
jgi:hypothetical protein